MTDLRTGIPGVGVIRPGTHICALYSGRDERDRLLVPFMREGRRRGDRCVCLIDDLTPASMRQRGYGPAGPGGARRPGHLDVYPAPGASPRDEEHSVQRLIPDLVPYSTSATDAPSPLLRAAGEMSGVPREPDASDLVAYETAVEQILAALPALFLCLYDVQRCGTDVLVNVLRIHSKVLLDGTVLHNPRHLAPSEYPAPPPGAVPRHPLARLRGSLADAGDPWLTLTSAEVRVAELVGRGLTNRSAAEELIVSPHTVDAHLKHMYVKLGIHTRVELTVLLLGRGTPTG